ncbi:MAG TPA: TRAP transporter small permease subunit [Rhodocyclaceae bacterium]|nr:TRAP transporter small permease subunit [Rhodocyclaceae bacterium]
MGFLLKLSHAIDRTSHVVGKSIIWLILAATLISALNAIARKAFNIGSNAFLEIQWYLYAAVFMLGAGHAFMQNAHVRIDVLANRLSLRTRMLIDIGGIVIFLLPLCFLVIQLSWPVVVNAYNSGEMSSNAGGLLRWPVFALAPLGFALLGLQGISELIKRLAFLAGRAPDPFLAGGHGAPSSESETGTTDDAAKHGEVRK